MIEPTSLMSPALAGSFFTTIITWEALPFVYSSLYLQRTNAGVLLGLGLGPNLLGSALNPSHWGSCLHPLLFSRLLMGFPGGSEVKASASNAGGLGSIPGSGRSPGEGDGNPLQYSCLENPMDGGAW